MGMIDLEEKIHDQNQTRPDGKHTPDHLRTPTKTTDSWTNPHPNKIHAAPSNSQSA